VNAKLVQTSFFWWLIQVVKEAKKMSPRSTNETISGLIANCTKSCFISRILSLNQKRKFIKTGCRLCLISVPDDPRWIAY
jgi:hypothetical protein